MKYQMLIQLALIRLLFTFSEHIFSVEKFYFWETLQFERIIQFKAIQIRKSIRN